MTIVPTRIRAPGLLDFAAQPPAREGGLARRVARAQNFAVTWLEAAGPGAVHAAESADELMLIVLGASTTAANAAGTATEVPARALAILPAGRWKLALANGATCVVLQSLRGAVQVGAMNEADYASADPRVKPLGAPYRPRERGGEVRILPIDTVQASLDRPRLKMVQTATMSINWVEYQGARDRTALSPHAHEDFEQGSLALAGRFTHHLRVEWGANADLWEEDRHATLGAPSLLVVPPPLIHTSEGVGPGHHILVDVFSPPRADFIANGWVYNAKDYTPPA